jgi:phosphatidylserine synthase
MEQVRATYKKRDAWWTVLLVDPLAGRLVRHSVGAMWITPTRLTVAGFLLGIGAAAAFWQATAGWLLVGAALYHTSFVVDCMDGKIARLRRAGTVVGSWLDFVLDRVRVFVCAVALFGGQFQRTGNDLFLLAGSGVIFLALFGYLNGAETDKAVARMVRLTAGAGNQPSATGLSRPLPGALDQLRAILHRHRIRLNLVSGVEFEMATLIVAPVAAAALGSAAILWGTGVAAGFLIAFELALMFRFWLTARSFDRARVAGAPAAGVRPDGPSTARTSTAGPSTGGTGAEGVPLPRQRASLPDQGDRGVGHPGHPDHPADLMTRTTP